MQVTTIGLDIAKNVFHVHAIDAARHGARCGHALRSIRGPAMRGDRHSRPAPGGSGSCSCRCKSWHDGRRGRSHSLLQGADCGIQMPAHRRCARRPLANGGRCQDSQAGAASPLLGRSEPTCRLTRRFLLRSRVEFLRLPRVTRSHSRANPSGIASLFPCGNKPPAYCVPLRRKALYALRN